MLITELFKEKYELNPDIFSSIKSVFSICLSNSAIEPLVAGTNCDPRECVKREAILNCAIGTWSSMMCVIASSNALQRIIRSHYPLTGDRRIATVLNARITPNVTTNSCISPIIDILWARSDESSNKLFTANHFVPLFVVRGNDYVTKTQEKKNSQFEI